ncbi:MAG: anaerobic ribonucleoside triphosphate reductase [Mailhella sp.]|nr:anaerobic ribonucleoside triphosphate reductase [Mailhella sp.]
MARRLADQVYDILEAEDNDTPDVEHVQDIVEKVLIEAGHARTAKAYILYRNERTRVREMKTQLMNTLKDLSFTDAKEMDLKRENANIDGDTPMGTMLRYGSEAAKAFYRNYLLKPEFSRAHDEGDIHIHDLDFLSLTTTCCQIDIKKLFTGGFNTGHGFLREPNSIQCAGALASIAIQSNQNDQHGGQSIPNFEYGLAPAVARSFIKNVDLILDVFDAPEDFRTHVKTELRSKAFPTGKYDSFCSILSEEGQSFAIGLLKERFSDEESAHILKKAIAKTDRDTYQAMEGLLHNLNTMHSRAGAQVPFSSINYGTDTSPEGRMVIKNTLLAEDAGLGNGETPIFPIHIFKVREGYSYNPGDPNYDMFKLACRVSAKRLFPNFSFMDAPFNKPYLQGSDPNHEVAYMGCRTRVMANRHDPSRETTFGRGNLSFTSINLPRIGLRHRGDIEGFFAELNEKTDLVFAQLLQRLEIQSKKQCRNYPFLMGQGIWLDSDDLTPGDMVGDILKHGTLTTGFIGLAECLKALIGVHHGESEEAQELGLRIVRTIRQKADAKGEETSLNFTVIATPAEGLAGRFVKYDRKLFGNIPGITDRDYYTNSFHIPVYFPISAYNKIRLEAPYHALTNGGHISYVEVDGDPLNNLQAFEDIVRAMKEAGIGYGSINHPVDRDPVCGYTGIIGDVCPRCGRHDGEGIPLSVLKQIKGYVHDSRSSDERKEACDKIPNVKF